jgi:uncharacterized protein YjbI with pentapeptide repeats
MAQAEHLTTLRQGVEPWNIWRERNAGVRPDLSGALLLAADLRGTDLSGAVLLAADLRGADLRGADLSRAILSEADLSSTDLSEADLSRAYLNGARLVGANLRGAVLRSANLREADLSRAALREANLRGALLGGASLREAGLIGASLASAELRGADLSGANLTNALLVGADLQRANLHAVVLRRARLGGVVFAGVDLSSALDLESVQHLAPSFLDIDTLYRSGGRLPEAFLRGCGVPEPLVVAQEWLTGARLPPHHAAYAVCASAADQPFAERLVARMRARQLRVWHAAEDARGDLPTDQIDPLVHVFDHVVLVVSEDSMRSGWIGPEVRRALRAEQIQRRPVLVPVRLVSQEALEQWARVDETGRDLAATLRAYLMPDFSRWHDPALFEAAFAQLLQSLRALQSEN